MNALTPTPYSPQSAGYSRTGESTMHLAKMLALVAPITMSSEQQEVWLRAAVDALDDIRPDEIDSVSLEVRRSITRPAQIVPEIAKLVAERRAHQRFISEHEVKALPGPPVKRHIADRDRRNFGPSDWAELNEWLESQGSPVRYGSDGKKLAA